MTEGPKNMGKSIKFEMPGVLRLSLMLLVSERLPIPATLAESSGISALNVSKLSKWWKLTLASANDIVSNPSMIMADDSVNGSTLDCCWGWISSWLLLSIASSSSWPPLSLLLLEEETTALGSSWMDVWGDSGPVCAGGAPPPTAEALSDWSLPDGGSMIDYSAQSNNTCTIECCRPSDHRFLWLLFIFFSWNFLLFFFFFLKKKVQLLVFWKCGRKIGAKHVPEFKNVLLVETQMKMNRIVAVFQTKCFLDEFKYWKFHAPIETTFAFVLKMSSSFKT